MNPRAAWRKGATAAIYLRISSDPEGREAGVERQLADGRDLAARLGLTVVAVYQDNDISASRLSDKPRPAYDRLLADAAAGKFRVILAYTSGRLTRRPREHEGQIELAERHDVAFKFVKSPDFDLNTAAGRLIARILAAKDAGEAEEMAERIQRAKKTQAEKGERSGGARPFGYERGGMVVREREKALIVDAIAAVTASTPTALYAIARKWTEAAPPTWWTRPAVERLAKADPLTASSPAEAALMREARRRVRSKGEKAREVMHDWIDRAVPVPGARWTPGAVKAVLINPRNAALIVRGERTHAAQWPALIERDEWEAVRAVLNDPARYTAKGATGQRWMGSGVYRCGQPGCDGRMRSATQTQRGGTFHVYRCSRANHLSIRATTVDEKVDALVTALLSRDRGNLIVRAPGVDVDALRRERNTLEARKLAASDAYAAGDLDIDEWTRASRPVKTRLTEINLELASIHAASTLSGIADAEDPAAAWRAVEDVETRRGIIAELMNVVILPVSAAFDGSADHRSRALRRVVATPHGQVTDTPDVLAKVA